MNRTNVPNVNKINKIFIMSILITSLVFAETPQAGSQIAGLVCTIYSLLTSIVPIIAFTLIVLAAIAYGAGQFFGADSRAKAGTWAMACLTGAIIMLIIYMIGPVIIKGLYGNVDIATLCPV